MGWFDIPNAIRAALIADTQLNTLVANRIHYQEIPTESQYPHIWFARTGREQDDLLDASEEMTQERFSFEIVGQADCESVVDRVIAVLNQFEGQVGARDVQLVDIDDADDDYLFKSIGEGEPDYLHALQVTIFSVEQTA